MKNETYTIKCHCMNCGHKFNYEVKKGVEAKNAYHGLIGVNIDNNPLECPNCETFGVKKIVS